MNRQITLGLDEIAEVVATHGGQRLEDVHEVMNLALQAIKLAVAQGVKVSLDDFGIFGAHLEAQISLDRPLEDMDCPKDGFGKYIVYPGGYEPDFSADEAFKELTRAKRRELKGPGKSNLLGNIVFFSA
jgi:hypothetical protein